jgi:hypothetical protein
LTEKLTDLRTELRNYTDNIKQAGRIRIQNSYQDKNGKNMAEPFTITKENKSKRHISIIREEGVEITNRQEILNRLQDNYFSTVGTRHNPTATLEVP